jgi:hypothetical protein
MLIVTSQQDWSLAAPPQRESFGQEKIRDVDVERAGKAQQVLERWVSLACFEFGDVGPLAVNGFGKALLGPAALLAQLADSITQGNGCGIARCVARLRHARIVGVTSKRDNTLIVTIEGERTSQLVGVAPTSRRQRRHPPGTQPARERALSARNPQ